MTIAIAWVRKVLDYEQLVFVSDSRISGGITFDACPKILPLPRHDSAVAFAGLSGHAFSMMLQLSTAVDAFPKARRRAHEISRVLKHALKVFGSMVPLIATTVQNTDGALTNPDVSFLFGGYSWRRRAFQLWRVVFSRREQRFVAQPAPTLCSVLGTPPLRMYYEARSGAVPLGQLALIGDQADVAKRMVFEKLQHKLRTSGRELSRIDMEPFEVVRDMLRDDSVRNPPGSESIGGAPQVVKVFQYMRTAPFTVMWPTGQTGTPHLYGRPCLGYERMELHCLDPDTLIERPTPVNTSNEGERF